MTRSNWEGSDIGTVVAGALEPYRQGRAGDQISIDGPALDLSARRALSLIMALHELATNATKYGALSTDDGCVAVTWTVAEDDSNAALRFQWHEIGGPPVKPPLETGFGSRLLTPVLPADFKGLVQIDYDPDGIAFLLTAPA